MKTSLICFLKHFELKNTFSSFTGYRLNAADSVQAAQPPPPPKKVKPVEHERVNLRLFPKQMTAPPKGKPVEPKIVPVVDPKQMTASLGVMPGPGHALTRPAPDPYLSTESIDF